ncbi:MAG: VanW family protein, partial [Thermoleophilia bacterium]
SSFTTEYPAGQSRVQNIHRIADLVDGVVLRPGEQFSINGHVGPRTRERGFTEGGVIVDGEFETAIGGGVSQFATTFFNAAYFGGYEILEHRPHSYYISRYPEGREATLNYPDIDVVIRNDSPYGLLVATSHSSTSVTVEMWGRKWVDVESVTSERRSITEPHITVRENHHLAPGQTRVVQSGRLGFTVSYTRTLSYHDGRRDEHTWTHTYRPEPRILERNTAPATPTTTTGVTPT